MNPETAFPSSRLEQVYLVERDAGLMCRILGLYAARGIDVLRAEYHYAAQDVMSLRVAMRRETEEDDECARVLVAKAQGLAGVIAAVDRVPEVRNVA